MKNLKIPRKLLSLLLLVVFASCKIGISVPKWKNIKEPVVLVQKAGTTEVAIYKVK